MLRFGIILEKPPTTIHKGNPNIMSRPDTRLKTPGWLLRYNFVDGPELVAD
jgi:hypothetical protein